MKKLITLLLTLVLALTFSVGLTACGEKDVTKIAVQKGTTSFMYADVLKGTETISYDTFALAATDMKNGNADYVFVDKTTAKSLCSEISGIKYIDIALSSENYGIGIDPAQTELKAQIDSILVEKAAEIEAIKTKYMNKDTENYVGITSATKDISKKDTQLVVATNAEFAPWEYKEGTKYYGIDMEIAAILAEELDMELVIDDMEFDMVVGAVGKQGVDIAMSGITITAERLDVINFSTPYYTEAIVVVCKADDTSLDSVGTVVDLLNVICVNK
jgi:ABC-type amino acid transport substrate-binding protein